MTDMLIRDVPDDVIAALDAHAGRLGLSRSEYVRRRLAHSAASGLAASRTRADLSMSHAVTARPATSRPGRPGHRRWRRTAPGPRY